MVRVWDLLVRFFPWSVVVAVLICFVTEDDALLLHVVAGYYVAGLIGLRILWGFVGPRHARFGDFLHPPGTVGAYARDLIRFRSRRYLGHSPAGGYMILGIMIATAALVWTGHTLYVGEEAQLAASTASFSLSPAQAQEEDDEDDERGEAGEELHEALANFLLLLIAVHVGGVLWASYAHRENLAWSMVTGDKRKSE